MPDKRKFHYFLNQIKDENPNLIELIESIQDEFDTKIDVISKDELKALKQYPIQFVKKVQQEKGEWTSQLHIWAEQCVPEIVDLDPIFLGFKNSVGDSVLMSLILGATGAYTEKVNYNLIKKVLNTDFSYEDVEKDDEGNDEISIKNVFDETDLNGKTVIDYLIDFAFGVGPFKGTATNEQLQDLLRDFAKIRQKQIKEEEKLEKEKTEELNKEKEEDQIAEEEPLQEEPEEPEK